MEVEEETAEAEAEVEIIVEKKMAPAAAAPAPASVSQKPGIRYIYPKHHTSIHVIKDVRVWEGTGTLRW